MKKRIVTAVGFTTLLSCISTLQGQIKTDTNMENLKTIAQKAQDAFFTDYNEEGVKTYFAANYIQHNPQVPTGIEPVLGFLPVLKEANTRYTNHRLLQDGEYVIFHNSYHNADAFGAKEVVAFDVWRMEDGKVAEHWDNLTPKVDITASGRSQVDGVTEITDLEKTNSNKKIVTNFVNDILFGKAPEKVTDYVSTAEYFQHNPMIKDGLEGLNEAISYLVSQNNMFQYQKLHKVFGEGNFVLTVSEGSWHGKRQAFYDLFRLKNDKIVEHWDVIQEVPEQMAHTNGKF
ncbi:nuclear transport factor 2 family protein [Tenacibaculum sp. FZY0031]|uniref:nuclear transport factor 2 family protein n=1 Tax=Tenacibaculum sp. FZY0031 TaxID=3116648 RepID=UPI002ECF185B|nr:nuclear transport factor 2 family protein [Tenacibaculum sp. FZY0031]